MRYTLPLILTLALCFAAQALALRVVGGRTIKSESNFFSSLARIQNGLRDKPDVILLGSSRIGRLPNIPSPDRGIANMGCDGGSAAITLRAIDSGILPAAPTIVIEGNTLLHDLEHKGHDVADNLDSLWFRLGCHLKNFSATARPSAILYSALLGRRIEKSASAHGELLPVTDKPSIQNRTERLPVDAESLVRELADIFDRLQAKDIRLMLVTLPPASDQSTLNIQIPKALSEQSGVPLLDLTTDLPPNAVDYTDGVHMAPSSAAAALRTILAALEKL